MRTKSSLLPAVTVLILWGVLTTILGQRGVFATTPERPPIPLLLAVVFPPGLFTIAYLLSDGFRRYVLGLDIRWLTAIQGWRLIGAMFLVLMSFGLLPGTFAWPAGVGDTIVGLYAPFVVYALVKRSPNWRGNVILLSVLGLLDFVGAIGGGALGLVAIGGAAAGYYAAGGAAYGAYVLDAMRRSPEAVEFFLRWDILHVLGPIAGRNFVHGFTASILLFRNGARPKSR